MAAAIPNQKWKRGGPAGPPVVANNASQRATRSRSTDREPDITAEGRSAEKIKAVEDAKTSSRGQPRKDESRRAEEVVRTAPDGPRRSKRDRRSADDNPWWISGSNSAVEGRDGADIQGPPKKRARNSPDIELASKGDGSRASRAGEESIMPRMGANRPHARRSKPLDVSLDEPSAQTESQPKRRGRPRKSGIISAVESEQEQLIREDSQPKPRGRPRLSNISSFGDAPSKAPRHKLPISLRTTTDDADNGEQSAASRRCKSKGAISKDASQPVAELEDQIQGGLPLARIYRHIEARTRQIPRSVVSAKWSPLDAASVEAISSIILDSSRPVLLRLRDNEQRHQQGQTILRLFESRLRSKLRRGMPFPPPTTKGVASKGPKYGSEGSHVDELNFENIVDSIESMEIMLDPLLHSLALLEAEKVKEEAALEKDYEGLRTLETNAKAEARGWRERARKAHALAPDIRKQEDTSAPGRSEEERLQLVKPENTSQQGLFHNINDDGLQSLSQQIASHLDSIEKNLQPVQDLLPAMGQSRAALQSLLQRRLASQQYERVLLG